MERLTKHCRYLNFANLAWPGLNARLSKIDSARCRIHRYADLECFTVNNSGGCCRALGKCFIYSPSCGCSCDCEHLYRRHRVRTSALTPHIHACRRQWHLCQRCSYSREGTTPTDGELSMIPPSDHACASRCLAGLCMSAEFVCC